MQKSPSRGRLLKIECLEPRIAPAAVFTQINPHSITYTDADGSHAYVTVSKGTLSASNFLFVETAAGSGRYQLEELDIARPGYAGADVNIYAHPTSTGGDGTVDIGWINATGIDLHDIRVHGDLGRITAGTATATATPAIENIGVLSIGLLGANSQDLPNSVPVSTPGAPASFTPSLVSDITGGVREWTVFGNIENATILVSDNGTTAPPTSGDLNGHHSYIGHMDIGGSVIGGSGSTTITLPGGGTENLGSGEIVAVGGFKTLHIAGDLVGGSAANSGEILTSRSILTLTINGSLRGDAGDDSGSVDAALIRHAFISGDVLGGAGNGSGDILGVGNNLVTYGGEITISGDVIGGAGNNSGYILENNPVQTFIGGDLAGGAGDHSGEISATRGVDFRVSGSLLGGDGMDSGSIVVNTLFGSVHVLRDMSGGSGEFSGSIVSQGIRAGHVTVSGTIHGGSPNPNNSAEDALEAGSIVCTGYTPPGGGAVQGGGIQSVTVGGSVIGGGGEYSGSIKSAGSVGPVSILGNLTAGSGAGTASILATDSIASVFIFGDIDGDSGTGVQFTGSPAGVLPSLLIGGDIKAPLFISLPVTSVVERGSIYSGDSATGALVATTIDSMHFDGGIIGSASNPVDILVSGVVGDDAINLLRVGASVTDANILAGYAPAMPDTLDTPFHIVTPTARIGTVNVVGDWAASNLVAGVMVSNIPAQPATITGTPPDGFSEIAKVIIAGEAIGDTNPSDTFVFAAQEVASVTVADYSFPLPAGSGNNVTISVGPTGNLFIEDIQPV